MSLPCISQEEKTKEILFMGSKFSFPYVDISTDVAKCKLILKSRSLKCWLYFCLFLWQTQK